MKSRWSKVAIFTTRWAYNEQGLANRVTPDSLPPVEWLTYGSGYLAGMKLGGTPLVEYTRDRLHRETVRSFGSRAGSNAAYELTSTYTPAGQLQSQHLNSLVYDRDYGWNDNGDLVRIIARVVSCISPAKFHECFINWMRDCHSSDDKDVIAIDGKTLRHSYDKSRPAADAPRRRGEESR